jgi:hypothetical protein
VWYSTLPPRVPKKSPRPELFFIGLMHRKGRSDTFFFLFSAACCMVVLQASSPDTQLLLVATRHRMAVLHHGW